MILFRVVVSRSFRIQSRRVLELRREVIIFLHMKFQFQHRCKCILRTDSVVVNNAGCSSYGRFRGWIFSGLDHRELTAWRVIPFKPTMLSLQTASPFTCEQCLLKAIFRRITRRKTKSKEYHICILFSVCSMVSPHFLLSNTYFVYVPVFQLLLMVYVYYFRYV